MEKNFNIANKKTLQKDPQYFGAYLNMARHNIFAISNDLSEKFLIGKLDNEEKISSSFLTDSNNKKFKEKQSHIFSNLKRFMPIVRGVNC